MIRILSTHQTALERQARESINIEELALGLDEGLNKSEGEMVAKCQVPGLLYPRMEQPARKPEKGSNCTTARFRLVNVNWSSSFLLCIRKWMNGQVDVICGLDLHSGCMYKIFLEEV